MMVLRLVGFIYCTSALWCLVFPELSSSGLGLHLTTASAKVEFISVYGGLQMGLGLAMIVSSFNPKLLIGAVFFSFIFSSILVVVRVGSILFFGANEMIWSLLFLELSISMLFLWYLIKNRDKY
ncbi:hypothetical protein NBRC116188_27610 [Oceaniserpentilla sp. 4NH20-0058]|uniref:DUF4345 family protein n=1 Tax=Oceaniserpentilla sp. 4NH20-0058 TaxID=3127660 RepID=UPI003106D868